MIIKLWALIKVNAIIFLSDNHSKQLSLSPTLPTINIDLLLLFYLIIFFFLFESMLADLWTSICVSLFCTSGVAVYRLKSTEDNSFGNFIYFHSFCHKPIERKPLKDKMFSYSICSQCLIWSLCLQFKYFV